MATHKSFSGRLFATQVTRSVVAAVAFASFQPIFELPALATSRCQDDQQTFRSVMTPRKSDLYGAFQDVLAPRVKLDGKITVVVSVKFENGKGRVGEIESKSRLSRKELDELRKRIDGVLETVDFPPGACKSAHIKYEAEMTSDDEGKRAFAMLATFNAG